MKHTSLALTLGLVLGACDPIADDPFADACRRVGDDFHRCRNLSRDEGDTYLRRCVARGNKNQAANATCGELWADAYACVADLSCEDFEVWRTASHDAPAEYPCAAEETSFRAECPGRPLWTDD